MHASTRLLLATLTLSACVLDTKLIDNPDSSAAVDDDTGEGADETSATTPDITTTEDPTAPVDEACALLPDQWFEWFVATNWTGWTAPIDEACTVTDSVEAPYDDATSLTLHLDCPQHAAEHGEFELWIGHGPHPSAAPQIGDVLDVYYQPSGDDLADTHTNLVFLRSEGRLIYAAALGSFIDPADVAAAAEHGAPLTVAVEPGPCALVENPLPGDASIAAMCEQRAIARLRVTSPDDAVVLDEFTSAELVAGDDTYIVESLHSRRGADCGEFGDLAWSGHALALQSAP